MTAHHRGPRPQARTRRTGAARSGCSSPTCWVLTKRRIARIRREPETLADVTIQPVLFI